MSSGKLSLYGLQKYMESKGSNIFSEMVMPEGIDIESLTDNILLESEPFTFIYSDADFARSAIGIWSKKYKRTFEKWVKALNLDYDPLSNYDRKEEWTDDQTGDTRSSGSNNVNGSNESNSRDRVTAYESDDLHTATATDETSNETIISSSDSTINNINNSIHKGRISGNIGVTTSQQMLQSELDLFKNFNLIQQITDLFVQEFCVMTY